MGVPSRGYDISAYIPGFENGVVIPITRLSAGFTTGVTNGGITSAKLATNSVRGAKISAGSITSAKIAAQTIISGNLKANAVHNSNISAKSITSAKIRAAFLSGSLVSGKKTLAVAHGLGVKPKSVVVCALGTLAQMSAATPATIAVAAASAATSANVYLIGSQTQNTALKYALYVQL